MAFFGAIFAVLMTLVVISIARKWSPWPLLDTAALFAMIGQPIGKAWERGEWRHPRVPDRPSLGVIYTHPDSFAPSATTAYHPAMIYEMFANFALLALLLPLRNRLPRGVFALAYLAAYAVSQLTAFMAERADVAVRSSPGTTDGACRPCRCSGCDGHPDLDGERRATGAMRPHSRAQGLRNQPWAMP